MSEQRIGVCSICGGEVVGYRGAWMATIPPPPDRCTSCGAVRAADVIEMVRPGWAPKRKKPVDWTSGYDPSVTSVTFG